MSARAIETLVVPQRTRRHRAARRRPLTVDVSERAVRLMRIQALAEETFGDAEKAGRWRRRPLAELNGEPPLKVSQIEVGAWLIETMLGKIAWRAAA